MLLLLLVISNNFCKIIKIIRNISNKKLLILHNKVITIQKVIK